MATKTEFEEILEKLKKVSKEKIIVVEGPKDKKALEMFGIKHIIVLRKPIYLVVEHIIKTGKECVILTDLDKKGKEIYGKLASSLMQFGVKIDNSFRNFLFKTKIRQIEGIAKYMQKLK